MARAASRADPFDGLFKGGGEIASGSPVDISEGKDRQQESGQGDDRFAQCAVEEDDGQRQQCDKGQCRGSGEQQDAQIE